MRNVHVHDQNVQNVGVCDWTDVQLLNSQLHNVANPDYGGFRDSAPLWSATRVDVVVTTGAGTVSTCTTCTTHGHQRGHPQHTFDDAMWEARST